jgi:hypothetical protein
VAPGKSAGFDSPQLAAIKTTKSKKACHRDDRLFFYRLSGYLLFY